MTAPRHGLRWTPEEDALLAPYLTRIMTAEEAEDIGDRIGRTGDNIKGRLHALRQKTSDPYAGLERRKAPAKTWTRRCMRCGNPVTSKSPWIWRHDSCRAMTEVYA